MVLGQRGRHGAKADLPTSGKSESIFRDHGRIVDAIARRDSVGAKEALRGQEAPDFLQP
jgi:DNA-binding FadR family transcriptional regulator